MNKKIIDLKGTKGKIGTSLNDYVIKHIHDRTYSYSYPVIKDNGKDIENVGWSVEDFEIKEVKQ